MNRGLLMRLLRFGVVGFIGLAVDTAVVYALRRWLGLYAAAIVSYVAAAACNWSLNRYWTFRDRARGAPGRQFALFLVASLAGLIPNRGSYALLIATSALCRRQPVLALAAGAVAGMAVNFLSANRLVYRSRVG